MDYINEITNWLVNHKSTTLPAWLKRNPTILDKINEATKQYSVKNVMERVYIVMNDGVQPQCEYSNPKQFNTFELGYRKGCIKGNKCLCVAKLRMENQKQTLLARYGTTSVSTIPGIVEKRRKTNMQKYGVSHPAQTEENKTAAKLRTLNRSADQKQKIREKSKITSELKYGAQHHMKTQEQQDKVTKTNMLKYGVKTPLQNDKIKAKALSKILSRTKEEKTRIQSTKQQTVFEKFQVEHPSQINLDKWVIDILTNKDKFVTYVSGKTREQVISELKIHDHTLYLRAKQYQATELFARPVRSQFEQEVFDFVSKFAEAEFSNRTILNGKELDIYIPKLKIAIECCGLYWHSENSAGRKRVYHYDKFIQCQQQGIKLITIFQDEWQFQQSQVQQRLQHLLNSTDQKIYARKCEIKSVSTAEAKSFLEIHHLQKHVDAKINLGLFYQNQLVSLMTFARPRYNKNSEYEILRFASVCNVVGAASKLFSHFINEYLPKSVISYSDNRWGNGHLYSKLGFAKQSESIGYFYTDYKNRFNRTQFQKHKLVLEGADPAMTEWQIMQSKGYDRIWDCGQSLWLWTKSINKLNKEITQ